MSVHVIELLAKTAANKERVTPVDIVMGDHWGELQLGSSLRLSLLRHILKKQQTGGGGRIGNNNQSRMRIPLEVVRRSPQAMVKVIRKGGTINARGMRDQMAYLEKEGDAPLERSERYFGTELDGDAKEALIEAWGLAGETKTNSDKTTHFVVSFPRDTDDEAAYRAGRAWAETMFASGSYGDVFDYYTAFHTDRAHPHIHVIVNRRGMENGDWLKVSRRSQFNYDEFRAVQVEVAALEGIILEASPRLARGESERPVPDAEIRNAKKEKREAKPPAHTPVTAIRAASTLILHAQQISADAELLEEHLPELASMMKTVAATISQGRAIMTNLTNEKPSLTLNEAKQGSEFIMSRRSEILDGIKEIDTEIGTLPNGPERSQFEREASRMKGDAAKLMPDVIGLQDHIDPKKDGYYRGIRAEDEREKAFKANADRDVGELAKSVGIDPVKFVARYEGSDPVSKALSD
ncbi:MAG: relaxase/mobilization nuclease domain-containing protein, partial [Salaquimonas sp.]